MINTYGPTETSISSNMAELSGADTISVGKPLLHYEEYIVDADLYPVPSGMEVLFLKRKYGELLGRGFRTGDFTV